MLSVINYIPELDAAITTSPEAQLTCHQDGACQISRNMPRGLSADGETCGTTQVAAKPSSEVVSPSASISSPDVSSSSLSSPPLAVSSSSFASSTYLLDLVLDNARHKLKVDFPLCHIHNWPAVFIW